jgi:hypothetical protein
MPPRTSLPRPPDGSVRAAEGGLLLDSLREDRHRYLFEETPGKLPENPPGFRAEDVLGIPSAEGFYPLPEAARMLGKTEEEVMEMARRFLLTVRVVGRTLYVRPAIVEEP